MKFIKSPAGERVLQEWEIVREALTSKELGLFIASAILSISPLLIVVSVFQFSGASWGLEVIKWRYELAFAAFVAASLTALEYRSRQSKGFITNAFVFLYFILILAAFFSSSVLGYYNGRDTLPEWMDKIKDANKLDFAYRAAAAISIPTSIASISSAMIIIFSVRRRFLKDRILHIDKSDLTAGS